MLRSIVGLLFLVLSSSALGGRAHGQGAVVVQAPPPVYVAPPPYGYPPATPYAAPPPVYVAEPYRRAGSIFGFAYRGMFTGALAGLGASYLAAQHSPERARAVGLSVGFGALGGTALGLGLGILDRVGVPSAYYVSRDLTYGVLFGAAVGALAGGVSCLAGGEGENALVGASIGSLGGLGLGLVVGIIEGQFHRPRVGAFFGSRARVSVAQMGSDYRSVGPVLRGRF